VAEQSSILESGAARVFANFPPSTLPNLCTSSQPEFRAERKLCLSVRQELAAARNKNKSPCV
jgi:hypothetical protein